ncbi:MAG: transcriptional regulator [Nakamurella sp.]
MASGNGAARRWALVLGLVAVLAALPFSVGAWPAADDDRSAAVLSAAALASVDVAFAGYAESAGGLALPATDQLGSVADLFSARTTMRVWWRGANDSRLDVVTAGGETDVYRDDTGSWTWEYEPDRVTRRDAAALGLPTATDLLPTTLARRLLSEAQPDELTRLPADRIAGRDALGLRLVPDDASASVARVDIWIDATSGLPLEVQIFGAGATVPALDSRFLDVDLSTPAAELTRFAPPAGSTQQRSDPLGALANAARDAPPIALPGTLAGLPRRTVDGAPPGMVLYGRGVTVLAVVPLPGRVARDLRRGADADPTAVSNELWTRIAVGPLGILVVDPPGHSTYGLIGTVTGAALDQAARELTGFEGPP